MSQLYEALSRISNPATILIFLILFGIVLTLVNWIFPTGVQNLTQTFNYSPQKAYQMMNEYGETGRSKHIRILGADLILVILYSILFSTTILYTLTYLFPSSIILHKLCLLPFLLAGVQFIEIVCVYILLKNYPREILELASMTNVVTIIKYILTYSCVLLSVTGFAGFLLKNLIVFSDYPINSG
jgi:hypothetical protein